MVRRTLSIMLLVALSASAATALGADARRQRPRPRPKDRLAGILAAIDKALDLNEEKLGQVEQVLRTHGQAMKNWQSENGEDLRDIQKDLAAAREAKDRDKYRALAKKREQLMAGMREIQAELPKRLGDVLTAEQIKKIMPLLDPRRRNREGDPLQNIMRALGRLNLTDDQRAAVRKIMADFKKAAAEAKDPAARAKLSAAAAKKIVETVLTDRQRAALAKMKDRRQPSRGTPFAGLDLGDDQKAALKKINETFMAAMKDADTPEKKRAVMRARWEQSQAVLTKEQLEQFRKQRQRQRGGDRRRPANRGGGDRRRPGQRPGGNRTRVPPP